MFSAVFDVLIKISESYRPQIPTEIKVKIEVKVKAKVKLKGIIQISSSGSYFDLFHCFTFSFIQLTHFIFQLLVVYFFSFVLSIFISFYLVRLF